MSFWALHSHFEPVSTRSLLLPVAIDVQLGTWGYFGPRLGGSRSGQKFTRPHAWRFPPSPRQRLIKGICSRSKDTSRGGKFRDCAAIALIKKLGGKSVGGKILSWLCLICSYLLARMSRKRVRTLQDFDTLLDNNPQHFCRCLKCFCKNPVDSCPICLSDYPSRLQCLVCTSIEDKPVTFMLERPGGIIIAEQHAESAKHQKYFKQSNDCAGIVSLKEVNSHTLIVTP